MQGLRILNLHPRLAARAWREIGNWGTITDLAKEAGFNALWLNPFHPGCAIPFYSEERQEACVGSLYAIRDHSAIDPAISSGDPEKDLADMKGFLAKAKAHDMTVFADCVFNHIAADHPLVLQEEAEISALLAKTGDAFEPIKTDGWAFTGLRYTEDGEMKEYYFKFAHADTPVTDAAGKRVLPVLNFSGGTGYDTAQINYHSPAARDFFVGTRENPGYWPGVVEWYQDLGFTGLRLDIAFKVPAAWWREIIGYAKERNPQTVVLAETLGGNDSRLGAHESNHQLANARLDSGEPAIDITMLSTHWWHFLEPWLFREMEGSFGLSAYGGAGSPDNHDTRQTVAQKAMAELREQFPGYPERDIQRMASDICIRNFTVAALLGHSYYVPLGYLYGLNQTTVFDDPAHFAYLAADIKERAEAQSPRHPLNIVERIKAINEFLEKLKINDVGIWPVGDGPTKIDDRLVRIDCELRTIHPDPKTGAHAKRGDLSIYVNLDPQNGPALVSKDSLVDHFRDASKNLHRLELGTEDRTPEGMPLIHDVAVFYTPVCQGYEEPIPPPVTGNHQKNSAPLPELSYSIA